MSSSPLTFLDLPPELKCRIMIMLDVPSLLNLSLTSKLINEVIYASDLLVLCIETLKSDLLPMVNIRSTAIGRRFLKAHLDARLNMPIATRPCVIFPAPGEGIRQERLFRGLFACITDNFMLHLWDIRRPDPTQPPPKIMMISQPHLMDALIEPDYNLLVLLCYRPGGDRAIIALRDLRSGGKDPHPWATTPFINHGPLSEEIIDSQQDQQLLSLRGELLGFVYCKDQQLESRRGLIWAWKTGKLIYDSMDFPSSTFHDLLLLPAANCFLVTASTFLINDAVALGAWIELRHCVMILTPPTSQLIAEFHLPEFKDKTQCYMGALDFYSSEPPNWSLHNINDDDFFPFVSNPITSVHVLQVWYKPKPGATTTNDGCRVYLIISNKVFGNALTNLVQQISPEGNTLIPVRKEWDEWGPWWTRMWDYDELGLLSGTSSVCGSRICTISHPEDDAIELLVVDFNMNFPCVQWKCTDPVAHFFPKTIHPGSSSPWVCTVRTWLPFHFHTKGFSIQREGDKQLICTTVLMDEERVIFATCVDEPDDIDLDPTSWKVVHLLREPNQQTAVGDSFFGPLEEPEDMDSISPHDKICRICRSKPHTDAHILLECVAHPLIVELRQNNLANIDLQRHRPVDEVFKELMAAKGTVRMAISALALQMWVIYNDLPRISELVEPDPENPVSIIFK